MASRTSTAPSLITDYLCALGVPFTPGYTNGRFYSMPFPTLFGMKKLLEEYGVKSEGYNFADKSEITAIESPFVAQTSGGYVVVTAIAGGSVTYLTEGQSESIPLDEFTKVWTGNVMLSYPDSDASEPDYKVHARVEFFMKAKKWVLMATLLLLFAYFFITNGIYRHISTIGITAIDIAGLWLTYMLVQKSLNIHNDTADRVCGVLQAGGCDSILETSASKFFGLFGWSEVGFAYFSVSLLTLLLFPQMLPWLALCNLCCLPFTFWSIWYQRFRAHKWCTLCVSVQASLWLLFFCYAGGGWLHFVFPPAIDFFVLGLSYLAVMLLINAVMPLIENNKDN